MATRSGFDETGDRTSSRKVDTARVLHWVARITAAAVVALLMAMAFGEDGGGGPEGWREWAYLSLFPFGFSAAYLLGWVRPLAGGSASLICMALSLVVIGRVFPVSAYLVWAVLSLPGVLYMTVGLRRRAVPSGAEGGIPT